MLAQRVVKALLRSSARLILCAVSAASLVPACHAADTWIEVKCPHFTVDSNAGEKEARKVCDQFELFRLTFHSAFSTLRIDPGQPLTIIAAKNENAMKEFLPEEYEDKGHIHHTGMYQSGPEKHYVVLRLSAEGDRAYHTLYHEYTHALMHLNFTGLPLWLDEGFAEYLGNASLGDKEVRIGLIDASHLYILRQNKLLPVETLLAVDHSSPYYNEQNRASVFYAESWALVHYLLLDPDARQRGLLAKFLAAWTASNDQLGAAQQSFGDLKKFSKVIESYARRGSFFNGVMKPPADAGLDRNYPIRTISPAEVLALRGDFFVHHNRADAAKQPLEEALKTEPNLILAHEAMGMYYYRKQDLKAADEEMKEAIRLGATSFIPRYMHGFFLIQHGLRDDAAHKEAVDALTEATKLNPQFAPAFDALASALDRSAQTRAQAVAAETTAVKLEPSTKSFAVHLVYLFLNADRISEAQIMAKRIEVVAQTPAEKDSAGRLMRTVEDRATWAARRKASAQNPSLTGPGGTLLPAPPASPSSADPATQPDQEDGPAPVTLARRPMAVDGQVTAIVCSKNREATLTLGLSKGPMTFHASDLGKIQISATDSAAGLDAAQCGQWKGHQAKIWFRVAQGKEYQGEILRIEFF